MFVFFWESQKYPGRPGPRRLDGIGQSSFFLGVLEESPLWIFKASGKRKGILALRSRQLGAEGWGVFKLKETSGTISPVFWCERTLKACWKLRSP